MREHPRAYVAAPVSAANGLFQALHWAFDQAEDLTWASIGILVADPDMAQELNHLDRLKTRGVKIGSIGQALRARRFGGVLIVYGPDRSMLAQAEDVEGIRGLAAVAVYNDPLRPWVDAYHPQRLGGQRLAPADPVTIDPAVGQALGHLCRHLSRHPGLTLSEDHALVARTLHRLWEEGHHYTADKVMATALRGNWSGHRAWALHEVASQVLTTHAFPAATGSSPLQPSP